MSIKVGEANSDAPKGNGFKFIVSSKKWLAEYGAAGSFDGDYRGVPGSDRFYPLLMGCESGRYRITADLAAKWVGFEKNATRLPMRDTASRRTIRMGGFFAGYPSACRQNGRQGGRFLPMPAGF